jgi:hypothetical protein
MMVFRRVVIRGVAEIGEVDVTGPVDPGFGRPGGGGRPDQGLPGYGHPDQDLPGYGHPDQGLPGYGHPDQGLPGRRPHPDQGLPGYGHPDQGLPGYGHPDHGLPGYGHPDQGLPGLPVYPSQGPILPAAPGHPIPVPRIPVVSVIPLPEGEVLPTEPPHRPGRIAVVVDGETKAVGWLQGSDDLPVAAPKGEAPVPGGHWVAVEVNPQARPKKCGDGSDGVGKTGFAWVFEVKPDWGTEPTPV